MMTLSVKREEYQYVRIDEQFESGELGVCRENESDNPIKRKDDKHPLKRKLVLVSIFMAYFCVFGTITVITPYFTVVASEYGISKTATGLMFSFYSVFGTTVGLVLPLLYPVLSPRTLLSGCLVLAGLSLIAFGFGTKLPNGTSFYAFSFVFRMLAAVGASGCYSTVISVVTQEFSNECGFVSGIGEGMAAFGALVAPALGGIMFQNFGYLWPTMLWGLLLSITAAIAFLLCGDIEFIRHEKQTGIFRNAIRILKQPGILIGIQIITFASAYRAALDPVISIFGKQTLHTGAFATGLMYSGLWMSYFVTATSVGKIVDVKKKHFYFFCLGFTFEGIGFLLLGPSPFFPFLPIGTVWLAVLTLILLGCAGASVLTPAMPYLLHVIRGAGGMKIDSQTAGVISAIFVSANHLGSFIGPTVITALADRVGLRMDFSIIGLFAFVEVLLLLLYSLWDSCYSHNKDPEMEEIHPMQANAAKPGTELEKPD